MSGRPKAPNSTGDSGLTPTSPAVASAIGVRIKELPLTPERVLHTIQACRQVGKG